MEDLDALVRRVDPDRWLASRFIADKQARADVIALYAFDYELSRVHRVTTQPLLGEMRLTWWSEAIAEIFEEGPVRRHPVTMALAEAVSRRRLPQTLLETMVEARFSEVTGGEADRVAMAQSVMRAAAAVLGASDAPVQAAAEAWASHSTATLPRANEDLRTLPAAAFPAVAYATLARAPGASALGRRLRLARAVLRGRL